MSTVVAPASLAGVLGEDWRRPGGSAHALAEAMRALVVDGRLAVRTRVPSERALAPELGVSRGTVSRAYDRLREDGFLVSARGAGQLAHAPGRGRDRRRPRASRPRGASISASPRSPPPSRSSARRPPAPRARSPAARRRTATPPPGCPSCAPRSRARFCERGVDTAPDQVLVTAGAQHALHLVLRLLCAPGDRVLVDAPAYPRTLAAVRGVRGRAVAVPLEPDGLGRRRRGSRRSPPPRRGSRSRCPTTTTRPG